MKVIILFIKVLTLSILGSLFMYLIFWVRGVVKADFGELIRFLLELTPMLCITIFLSLWYKKYHS
ncbi:hypothetical protein A4G20_07515 [Pasteurellaceae bacterium RH1A]|nr:hypothetical protein A4G20_07515 [Pasteurellaceae bacterium RH1A]